MSGSQKVSSVEALAGDAAGEDQPRRRWLLAALERLDAAARADAEARVAQLGRTAAASRVSGTSQRPSSSTATPAAPVAACRQACRARTSHGRRSAPCARGRPSAARSRRATRRTPRCAAAPGEAQDLGERRRPSRRRAPTTRAGPSRSAGPAGCARRRPDGRRRGRRARPPARTVVGRRRATLGSSGTARIVDRWKLEGSAGRGCLGSARGLGRCIRRVAGAAGWVAAPQVDGGPTGFSRLPPGGSRRRLIGWSAVPYDPAAMIPTEGVMRLVISCPAGRGSSPRSGASCSRRAPT